jgi:uncharacterized protein YjbI with pentapeptide repeats
MGGVDMSNALLIYADLIGTDLSFADLRNTLLQEATLTGADLRHAKEIKERSGYLGRQSFSLAGATMPNG